MNELARKLLLWARLNEARAVRFATSGKAGRVLKAATARARAAAFRKAAALLSRPE